MSYNNSLNNLQNMPMAKLKMFYRNLQNSTLKCKNYN